MSAASLITAIATLNAMNAAIRGILEMADNAGELRELYNRARQENRDITADEAKELLNKASAELAETDALYAAALSIKSD